MPIPSTPRTASPEFTDRVEAHRGILFKVAASYGRSAEDRADLIQDITLQLWRAWPGYDPGRPFATWMYRIALNVAITQQRRERPLAAHDPLGEEHADLIGLDDVDAEDRERLALVQRAMRALGALDRALLLLHLDGCSHREIGEVLGIRDGNVATRLGRIKQHLRRQTGAATRNEGETR
ncbi:MAG TPA: sigma-70 family RNA polymerase sigma factor [Dokdonella sp.]|uniref:RNA polymerase sigma factor n=1 Tax=Dokdonella sp. TaxID=2291710 RepID=UPI002BBBD869|nr:sigma-70 family RNA polymerase sigma factor [Dokdonella sp.]HUD43128.1 sigma-70 family RNA polymerase sigma factor [Dokdonella sp.]